tara:strand:- start:1107 stop:2036 length:930 start_codon:yes stop_codon:yes gene_type:complete
MNLFKPRFWDRNKISFLSILLFPFAILFELLNFVKRSSITPQKCPVPVICVGNIYLGGTGKTPLSVEIFHILKNLNKNPAFVRKKYDAFQDESKLQKKIGSVYESKKRIEAIKEAAQNNIDVVILDDGFQDYSIKKDLSLVCFSEKQWIGNGLLIPSGPLRERLSALKRANCVMINGPKNTNIEDEILKKNKNIKIFYTIHKAENVMKFRDRKIIAFAGIGNPNNFFDLLRDNNINLSEKISFPDHYPYSQKVLQNLQDKSSKQNATLLTTEKDFFRINKNFRNNIDYLKIIVELENKEKFIEEIKKII